MNVADEYIKRQILTQRYMNTLTRKYYKQLVEMNNMVANMIIRSGSTPRLEAMRKDLELAVTQSLLKFNDDMLEDLGELSAQELDFVGKTINANSKVLLNVPKYESIKRAIFNSTLDVELSASRLTLGQALEEFSIGQAKAIRQVLFDGLATGQTLREMSSGVRALSADRSKAQVTSLTRTLASHTTAQTRKEFAMEYNDVFDGEEWVAVLDTGTTVLCAGRDGTVYPVGMGPYPPAHWQCRSLRIPVMMADYDAQTNKSKKENFDTWLRDQPADFQDEYFEGIKDGVEKAELFRRGGLHMEQFTDSSGREYSLDELLIFYSDEAKKANVAQPGQ
jgi:SPP1 gp7 family putative phage head morphogenesis protein